jgi:hypothetical protein
MYFPPSKYYAAYLHLEQTGYIAKLKAKYGVDEFLENRKKEKGKH